MNQILSARRQWTN